MPEAKKIYSGFSPHFIFGSDGQPKSMSVNRTSESWMLLFSDLVYVAMLSKLSRFIEQCDPTLKSSSFHIIIVCFAIFNILFVARLALDEYCNRFFENDLFHQFILFVYIFGVMVMVMNAQVDILPPSSSSSSEEDGECVLNIDLCKGFTYGFFLTRG